MDNKDLTAFRKMVGLSQNGMADMLGYGRRQYQQMERGASEIRNSVGLACAAYALGLRYYDGPVVQEVWRERTRRTKKK